MIDEQYLTIKQTARILGVTPLTLRNWDKKGALVAYRNPVNNYRLYRYADVSDFIAAIKRSGPRRSGSERLPVRLEEEATPDAGIAIPEAEPEAYGDETGDAGSAHALPPTYDQAPPPDTAWQTAEDEEPV